MKKIISILAIAVLLLTCFVSCNSEVDEKIFKKEQVEQEQVIVEHQHYYKLLSDGSWQCSLDPCTYILEGTESPYITVVVDNQPTEIIPLTGDIEKAIGVGKIVVDGSVIKYTNTSGTAQEVVIRTDGGNLTINASTDHMEHFGTLDFLQIDAIKTSASYVENGYTAQGQIKEGRVVNTKGIIEVDGEAKATGVENLFIETNELGDGFGIVVIASKDGADLPVLDRGEVKIGSGVLVVEVQELTGETKTSDEYIWLFGNGTVEAERVVVTSETEKPSIEKSELNTATKSGKAGGEIANIAKKNAAGTKYLMADGVTETENADEAGVEEKASKNDIEKGTTLFEGGAGTRINPYLVSSKEQFLRIESSNSGMQYYKLQSDIELAEEFEYVAEKKESYYIDSLKNVCIDGGHHIISTRHYSFFDGDDPFIFGIVSGHVILKNLTVCNGMAIVYELLPESDDDLLEFINVNTVGTASGSDNNNSARYVAYLASEKNRNINFINCDTYSNVIGSGYVGGYIGEFYWSKGATTNLSFIDCDNYGNLISTGSGFAASMFISNPTNYGSTLKIIAQNCSNKGNIIYSGTVNGTFCYALGGDYSVDNTTINGTNIKAGITSAEDKAKYLNDISAVTGAKPFKSTVGKLTANDGKFVLQTVSGASRYELIFSFSGANGSNAGYKFMFDDELPSDIKVSEWLSYSDTDGNLEEHNKYNCTYYTYDGKYVYNEPKAKIGSNVTATFIAYNSEDNLVGIYTYTYSR